MTTIPIDEIQAAWDKMCSADQAAAVKMAQKMQEEQPALMVYLLAQEENLDSAEEPGWLMQLGCFVWFVFLQQGNKLREVSPEQIEKVEDKNIRYLENLDQGSEIDHMDASKRLITSYNQAPLLGFLIEMLMQNDEDAPELAGDDIGMGLLILKTVVDCLDQ